MFRSLLKKFNIKKSSIYKCSCSFCGCNENEKNPLIAGDNAYICPNCVRSACEILFGELEGKENCIDEYVEIDFFDVIRK